MNKEAEAVQRQENVDPRYCGYRRAGGHDENSELTHVGPGTPCGEYMRRFWHPVALSSELGTLPKPVRILGEDLVLYRDGRGCIGLLHRQCIHRGVSLEYGVCERIGIRCCYHGWLYDVDGTILEIPGDAEADATARRIRETRRIGAYPTVEVDGIIFAYLGPAESQPQFPVYDTFDMPGIEKQPYRREYPCNWLQITENAMDPLHAVFLHVRATGPQFDTNWGSIGVWNFFKRDTGFYYTNARRVGSNVWVRVHEVIMPNLTHAGAVMSMNGKTQKYFGRNSFTRWVVPVDDTHSRVIAWANFGDLTDPSRDEWRTSTGIDILESGMPFGRPAEEAQRFPGDFEAFIGQGEIASNAVENLTPSDRGVGMFRARLRFDIRALQSGSGPYQPAELAPGVIPTYCGDTVLEVPPANGDEATLVSDVSKQVIDIIRSGDGKDQSQRYADITKRLKDYERSLRS